MAQEYYSFMMNRFFETLFIQLMAIKYVYFSDGYTISDVVMYWRDQPVVGVEVRWTDEGWQYGSQPPDHFHFRH